MKPLTRSWLSFVSLFISVALVAFADEPSATPSAAGDQPGAPAAKASAADPTGDPLPERALLRMGSSRFRPPSGICDIALSPDERVIVTVGRQLIVWDTTTGKELWRVNEGDYGFKYSGPSYGVRAVAFAADSARFYTTGGPNEVAIWNTYSGERKTLTIPGEIPNADNGARIHSPPRCLDVTPDAKQFALGDSSGVVVCDAAGNAVYRLANAPDREHKLDNSDRLTFFGHNSFARFSPDGKSLAVVTSDRPDELRLYDAGNGMERTRIKLGARLVRLAFSPDSRRIATTERDSSARMYDLKSGLRLWQSTFPLKNIHENYASAIAVSPDAATVAVCATDYRIYLLNATTGEIRGDLKGHRWYPWALAFTADGKQLYSSGWDEALRRWDVAAQSQLGPPVGIRGSPVATASPDGQWLAYADDSGVIRLVDSRRAVEGRHFEIPGSFCDQLTFSPDGSLLAAATNSETELHVAVWALASGKLLHRWDWPKGRDSNSAAEALCFNAEGKRLAAAVFRQSAAYIWDLTTGEQTAELKHNQIYGLSFSPDGTTLATAGWDSCIRLWDVETRAMRREAKVADHVKQQRDLRMYAICYSPHGGVLATADMDHIVRIWDAELLAPRSHFRADDGFIYGAFSYSPDGLWLATGGSSGTVSVWDPTTGKKVWGGGRHESYVYTVSFGGDGRTLVSGGDDRVAYLWDLRPGEVPAESNLVPLWGELSSGDSETAYVAMWSLVTRPEQAVALLAEKLRAVQTVIDTDRLTAGISAEEIARRNKLLRSKAQKDPTVLLALTLRRALTVLAEIGTPAALGLLDELAKKDRQGTAGQLAAAALKRAKIIKQP